MSVVMYEKKIAFSTFLLMAMIRNAKAGTETSTVPPLQEVIRTGGLSEGDKVYAASVFGMPLELFIVLVVIVGIAIVGSIVILVIKKPNPTSLGESFEEALQELELTGIKGIGSKRTEELKAVGVNTVSDLAASSAMDLSQKTGIPKKTISRWIGQAKELIE